MSYSSQIKSHAEESGFLLGVLGAEQHAQNSNIGSVKSESTNKHRSLHKQQIMTAYYEVIVLAYNVPGPDRAF